ncbi:MAG: hypothetical protein IPK06_02230 [Ignavibacteriae bacterium]|nr:hypothetical protein [Ignavibacteriota bacterium]
MTVSSHALHKNLVPLVFKISELKNDYKNLELKIVGPEAKYGTKKLKLILSKLDPKNEFIKLVTAAKYEDLQIILIKQIFLLLLLFANHLVAV